MTRKQPTTDTTSVEYRYTVAARDRQLAVLQREGSTEWRKVKLFEVSPKRLLLEIDEPFPVHEGITIKLDLSDGEEAIELLGLVEWSQMSVRGDWWMSCELIEAIPDRFVDRLAHQHFVERRQDPRFPIDLDAEIRFELSEEWTAGKLVDYSAGGFQVQIPQQAVTVGQRILLRAQNPSGESVDLAARIVWSSQQEAITVMGCAFVQRNSYLRFRALLGLHGARNAQTATRPKPNGSGWLSRCFGWLFRRPAAPDATNSKLANSKAASSKPAN